LKTVLELTGTKKQVDCAALLLKPAVFLSPFDARTIAFLNDLSVTLLSDKEYRRHPEIVSLAFWLRKASLEQFQKENKHWMEQPGYAVLPQGTVFHIAPSNVDTIFLYSACISLLMGNKNIVRLSAGLPASVTYILDTLHTCLMKEQHLVFQSYLHLVSYGHDDEINSFFSQQANTRVIWGGDSTVKHFKSLESSAALKDIVFPNRVSHALLNANTFLQADAGIRPKLATDFFNDAFVFDQLGCSSPRVIFVLCKEEDKKRFTSTFYEVLNDVTKTRYPNQAASLAMIKFNHLMDDVLSQDIEQVSHKDNSIYLLEKKDMPLSVENCVGGYFYLNFIHSFAELAKALPASTQTLSHFGFSPTELSELNEVTSHQRIDRIVPVGQALAFHYLWDGLNLFEQLSLKRAIF
jgi:hypothetical protein